MFVYEINKTRRNVREEQRKVKKSTELEKRHRKSEAVCLRKKNLEDTWAKTFGQGQGTNK